MAPRAKSVLSPLDGKPQKLTIEVPESIVTRIEAIKKKLSDSGSNYTLDLQDHLPKFIEQLVTRAESELNKG